MKLRNLLVVVFLFSFVLGASFTVNAQEEPWKLYTGEEQYLKEKGDYNTQITNLQSDIDKLNNDITALNADLKDRDAKVKKAEDELKSFGDESAFVKDLEKLEKIANDKDKSGVKVEDAEKMLADLKTKKFKCKYQTRLDKIAAEIEKWKNPVKPPSNDYTVVKGDCLWKISKAKYNEPKAWFAIWEKNKEGVKSAPPKVAKTIKNPNLIYPGQVLVIPTLNDADKKAAIEKTKKYNNKWRKKSRVKKENVKKEDNTDVKKDEKKDVKKDTKKDVKKEEPKKDVKKEEPKKK